MRALAVGALLAAGPGGTLVTLAQEAAGAPSADPLDGARLLGGEVLVFQFDWPQDFDPVLQWAIDESPFEARGYLSGPPCCGEGRHGDGLASNNPVNIVGLDGLQRILAGDFSLSFWTKRGEECLRPCVEKLLWLSDAAGTKLEITREGCYCLWYLDEGNNIRVRAISGLPSPGTWVNLAVVVQRGSIQTYVDGNPSGPASTFAGLRSQPFTGASLQAPWPNSFDELRVYDRALSQEEVRSIMLHPYGANRAPVARIAKPAPAECVAGEGRVVLDGSFSYDPDGDALTFAWSAPRGRFERPTEAVTAAWFPPGTTVATLRASDGQLTGEANATVEVVDSQAPEVSIELEGPRRNGWWNGPVDALVRATDGCGVRRVLHALDGGPDEEGARVPVAGSGWHALRGLAEDLGGRQGAREVEVAIDVTPPVTTHDRDGRAGLRGWWTTDVNVTLRASDAHSGVAATWAAVDDGPFERRAEVKVKGDGRHTVRFFSEDQAGNVEAERRLPIDMGVATLRRWRNTVDFTFQHRPRRC